MGFVRLDELSRIECWLIPFHEAQICQISVLIITLFCNEVIVVVVPDRICADLVACRRNAGRRRGIERGSLPISNFKRRSISMSSLELGNDEGRVFDEWIGEMMGL